MANTKFSPDLLSMVQSASDELDTPVMSLGEDVVGTQIPDGSPDLIEIPVPAEVVTPIVDTLVPIEIPNSESQVAPAESVLEFEEEAPTPGSGAEVVEEQEQQNPDRTLSPETMQTINMLRERLAAAEVQNLSFQTQLQRMETMMAASAVGCTGGSSRRSGEIAGAGTAGPPMEAVPAESTNRQRDNRPFSRGPNRHQRFRGHHQRGWSQPAGSTHATAHVTRQEQTQYAGRTRTNARNDRRGQTPNTGRASNAEYEQRPSPSESSKRWGGMITIDQSGIKIEF